MADNIVGRVKSARADLERGVVVAVIEEMDGVTFEAVIANREEGSLRITDDGLEILARVLPGREVVDQDGAAIVHPALAQRMIGFSIRPKK
jgi:hypothetical protein